MDPENSDLKDGKTSLSASCNRHHQYFQWSIAALTAAVLFVVVILFQSSKSPTSSAPDTCGNSSSEAQALGCNFDIMSFAWLPSRCFDAELMGQFLALREWQWYLDTDGLKTADPAAVAAGQFDELYVTQEYHMYHCTYMWRKMHRAILAGEVLDGYIGDLHHTAHCEMQILDRTRTLDMVNTTIYTKFVTCPWKQVENGRWGWYRVIDGRRVHRDP